MQFFGSTSMERNVIDASPVNLTEESEDIIAAIRGEKVEVRVKVGSLDAI